MPGSVTSDAPETRRKAWHRVRSHALCMRRVVGYAALTAIALVAAYGFLAYGPYSLRAEYRRDVAGGLARRVPVALVSETDLARLPVPVQRYLRVSGVV